MAVFNAGKSKHKQIFYGNSTDTKPTSCYESDLFHEFDTNLTYIYNGTNWELDESTINIKSVGEATDGSTVYGSYEKDPQGYGVKRVVIAAYPSLTLTHTTVEVGTTSTEILPENPNRKYLLIINHSDTDVYCSFGVNAVVNKGILVVGNQNNIEQNPWVISTQAINGIHGGTAGTMKTLLVTEGV